MDSTEFLEQECDEIIRDVGYYDFWEDYRFTAEEVNRLLARYAEVLDEMEDV